MNIKKVIKTPQGEYTFQGELDEEEFDFIFGLGLSVLLTQGALNLAEAGPEEGDILN